MFSVERSTSVHSPLPARKPKTNFTSAHRLKPGSVQLLSPKKLRRGYE